MKVYRVTKTIEELETNDEVILLNHLKDYESLEEVVDKHGAGILVFAGPECFKNKEVKFKVVDVYGEKEFNGKENMGRML